MLEDPACVHAGPRKKAALRSLSKEVHCRFCSVRGRSPKSALLEGFSFPQHKAFPTFSAGGLVMETALWSVLQARKLRRVGFNAEAEEA